MEERAREPSKGVVEVFLPGLGEAPLFGAGLED